MRVYEIHVHALNRMRARRNHWENKQKEAMRTGNLSVAAGFQCRAIGVHDAMAILEAAIEEWNETTNRTKAKR